MLFIEGVVGVEWVGEGGLCEFCVREHHCDTDTHAL